MCGVLVTEPSNLAPQFCVPFSVSLLLLGSLLFKNELVKFCFYLYRRKFSVRKSFPTRRTPFIYLPWRELETAVQQLRTHIQIYLTTHARRAVRFQTLQPTTCVPLSFTFHKHRGFRSTVHRRLQRNGFMLYGLFIREIVAYCCLVVYICEHFLLPLSLPIVQKFDSATLVRCKRNQTNAGCDGWRMFHYLLGATKF